MKGFHLTASGSVLTEWIDRNGHMNVTAYMSLFDKGTFVLLDSCEFGSPRNDLTIVAARVLIDYRKELMEGEPWELWSGVVSAHPSYLTVTHRLRGGASLRAVCDIRGTPFLRQTRTSTVLENWHLKAIGQWVVPGLVDRFNPKMTSSEHR